VWKRPDDLRLAALQAGCNAAAVHVLGRGSVTCRDTVLVGWGGATDEDAEERASCPVAGVEEKSTRLELEGCTLQLHPDSTHVLPTSLLCARRHGRIQAANCRMVGPAPGSCTAMQYGVWAQAGAVVNLVGG
jgi:hypothetical protein